MLVVGIVVQPVLPHFQLDEVLTLEQLRDGDFRESALEILKRLNAVSNERLMLSFEGVAVKTMYGISLCLSRKDSPSADSQIAHLDSARQTAYSVSWRLVQVSLTLDFCCFN